MKNDTKMTLLMLMATVFWAGAFITGKMGVYALSPLVLTFLRMFFFCSHHIPDNGGH